MGMLEDYQKSERRPAYVLADSRSHDKKGEHMMIERPQPLGGDKLEYEGKMPISFCSVSEELLVEYQNYVKRTTGVKLIAREYPLLLTKEEWKEKPHESADSRNDLSAEPN